MVIWWGQAGGIMTSFRLFLIQCLEKFWMSYWWILFNKRMVSWWNNFSILVDWFVLLHMMNLSSVILEVCKLCHTNATNVTFKRLEFFMNYLNMFFLLCSLGKIILQFWLAQGNCLPLWTASICLFSTYGFLQTLRHVSQTTGLSVLYLAWSINLYLFW